MDGLLFDKHLTTAEIEAGIPFVLDSPRDEGILQLIVRRPAVDQREVISEGELDVREGLIGDNWLARGSSRTRDGLGHPEMQINVMNYRFAELVAGSAERVRLAGDQLFVDLDLSRHNLPPGAQLSIGSAIIEITPVPHLGCKKFVERFGLEAMKFANSEFGRAHNLRGVNAKVVHAGRISVTDSVAVIRRGSAL